MGVADGLNLLNFFNFFAFKTEKVHFTPKNRARIAKLSVPIDSAVKKYIEICTLDVGKFFWRSCKTFIKVIQSEKK